MKYILFRKIYIMQSDAYFWLSKTMPMYCCKIGEKSVTLKFLKCVRTTADDVNLMT